MLPHRADTVDAAAARLNNPPPMHRSRLYLWIIAGMLLGVAIGLPLNILAGRGAISSDVPLKAALIGNEIGNLFLRLLQMIVIPLIICSLISGVAGIGDPRKLGRIGAITFASFAVTGVLALALGLTLVNLIKPGVGADLASLQASATTQPLAPPMAGSASSPWHVVWNQIVAMIPKNPFAAAAAGDMLPVIFFSLFTGVFITLAGGKTSDTLKPIFDAGFDLAMRMAGFVIQIAPVGVFGFMLYASAGKGLSVFAALGWYMLTVFLGLLLHTFLTLPLLLKLAARRPPWQFVKAMGPMIATGFSTGSSNATLPVTMMCVEQRAGISNRISSFVLPLGATVNMNGTALYEAVAVIFIAQAYGHDLTLTQQLMVAFTALLVSVGAAGIPHAGTVMMFIVLSAVNLPADAVGLILAVDRILDMSRTVTNVFSDCVACAIVARFEPDLASAPSPRGRGPG